MGWRGDAPATETRTKAAPVQAAASIRWAWPARSTEAGEAPPGPVPVSLTARCGDQAPGVAVASAAADTTHTRFAATTLTSTGWAAHPPTGELRVPNTT